MTYEELLAEMRRLYMVEYAYPESDNASLYGFYWIGCYFVSRKGATIHHKRTPASSHGYRTREEAQAVANIMMTETVSA